MLALWEIPPGGCHYPLTDEPPHYFCGEPVTETEFEGRKRKSSYCAKHHKLCYTGRGKAWQALAGMIDNVEQYVMPTPRTPADVRAPLDEMVRAEGRVGGVVD